MSAGIAATSRSHRLVISTGLDEIQLLNLHENNYKLSGEGPEGSWDVTPWCLLSTEPDFDLIFYTRYPNMPLGCGQCSLRDRRPAQNYRVAWIICGAALTADTFKAEGDRETV
jgi:hypothetical protein